MVSMRLQTLFAALLVLWCSSASQAVELDANHDGKIDDNYIPSTITRDSELSAGLAGKQDALGFTPENAAKKGTASGYAGLGSDGKVPTAQLPTIPTAVSQLSEDATHRTVSDTEKTTWNGKQAALGYTPENTANKGAANGYAGLGSDGKVPASQLPEATGTDDQTAAEVPTTTWGSYTGTNVQALMQEVDTALRALIGGAALPTWMPSVGPTNGRQILQATGGCSLSAYDNQADCQTNSGIWTTPTYQHTSIISGLINDTGTADDDLWSAAKITSELAGKQATLVADTDYLIPSTAASTYQPIKGADDNYVTDAEKAILGNTSGTNTGDQDLSGYQLDLTAPDQAEAEAGTATTERAWTAQRVAQAIAALAPSGSVSGYVPAPVYSDAACTEGQRAIHPTYGPMYCKAASTWDYQIVSGTSLVWANWLNTTPPASRTLTVVAPDYGTITSSDSDLSASINCGTGGSACTATASNNTAIAISATADSGYTLSAFTGASTSTSSPISITMDADKTLSALFAGASPGYADDFATLSANWVTVGGLVGIASVSGGVSTPTDNSLAGSVYTGVAFSPDQSSRVQVVVKDGGSYGPVVRASGSNYGYHLIKTWEGWVILKQWDQRIAVGTNAVLNDGDYLKLTVTGSSPAVITGYICTTPETCSQVVSVSDASTPWTSGYPGVRVYNTSTILDNFFGSDL